MMGDPVISEANISGEALAIMKIHPKFAQEWIEDALNRGISLANAVWRLQRAFSSGKIDDAREEAEIHEEFNRLKQEV